MTTPKPGDTLLDRAVYCLRAYRNAMKQGRPVATYVEATTEDVLREYDLGNEQDREDAERVMRRLSDPTYRREP